MSENLNGEKNVVDKKVIREMFAASMAKQASWSYERMQGIGFTVGMAPALKEIYKDDEEGLEQALVRHTEFFNTGPTYAFNLILGATAALEEQKADPVLIRGVKTGMMGPLAAIGDTLNWAILGPLVFSIPASMAIAGNITGAYIALAITQVLFIGWNFFVQWKTLNIGYEQGAEVATSSENILEKVTFGAGVLGLIVVGALIPNLIDIGTPLVWQFGEFEFILQDELDTLLPSMIPLLFVAGSVYLIKERNWPTTRIILMLFIVAIALGGLGIIA